MGGCNSIYRQGVSIKEMKKEESDHQIKTRQSNLELLRIVAMVIIVMHHFGIHGEFSFSSETISINRLWIQFITMGGRLGVNIFVLISGYFLVSTSSIRTIKVLKLWGQIFFYSITIFFVFSVLGLRPFSIAELIRHLAPIIYSQWWFASLYFVLYLLTPYINRLLRTFDKKQYICFLALLIFMWSIVPTFTMQTLYSNYLLWFIVTYSIAGYFKIFGVKTKLTGVQLIGLSITGILLTFSVVVLFDILGTKIPFFSENALYLYEMNMAPMWIIAVLMFLGFSKLDIGHSKILNMISSATFGVYLIHDNLYMRPFLWERVFKNASYVNSRLLIPFSLIVVFVVFVGCSIIELGRIYIFENNIDPIIRKISLLIDSDIKPLVSEKLTDLLGQ